MPHNCQVKVEIQALYMVSTYMLSGRVITTWQVEKFWLPKQLSLIPPWQGEWVGALVCHSKAWQKQKSRVPFWP